MQRPYMLFLLLAHVIWKKIYLKSKVNWNCIVSVQYFFFQCFIFAQKDNLSQSCIGRAYGIGSRKTLIKLHQILKSRFNPAIKTKPSQINYRLNRLT